MRWAPAISSGWSLRILAGGMLVLHGIAFAGSPWSDQPNSADSWQSSPGLPAGAGQSSSVDWVSQGQRSGAWRQGPGETDSARQGWPLQGHAEPDVSGFVPQQAPFGTPLHQRDDWRWRDPAAHAPSEGQGEDWMHRDGGIAAERARLDGFRFRGDPPLQSSPQGAAADAGLYRFRPLTGAGGQGSGARPVWRPTEPAQAPPAGAQAWR